MSGEAYDEKKAFALTAPRLKRMAEKWGARKSECFCPHLSACNSDEQSGHYALGTRIACDSRTAVLLNCDDKRMGTNESGTADFIRLSPFVCQSSVSWPGEWGGV